MDVPPYNLTDDPAELKRLLLELQQINTHQQTLIERHKKISDSTAAKAEQLRETVIRQKTRIEILEEQLLLLRQHQFGRRSEKNFNANQLSLFNEAEIVDDEPTPEHSDEASDDERITIPEHTRKKRKKRSLPDDLPQVDIVHDLDEDQKQCSGCGQSLQPIGEEVTRQLCVIPQQHFVVCHRRLKYACECKACIRTAKLAPQPIPGSEASARFLSYVMVRKYLEGIPLYRQEKIAERDGLYLPRHKLARWMIKGSAVFIPLLKYLEEAFFSYDIALSDDTGIRVLKEDGRLASSQSALWIRKGGPPEKPVVLVDYDISKSAEACYRLLSDFHGYLVSDGAESFALSVRNNQLTPVLCNDHARRRFHKAATAAGKDPEKTSIARQALSRYRKLYRLEREIKHLPPEERKRRRQTDAVGVWTEFIEWATKLYTEGVSHGRTSDALAYLLNHQKGLQEYCNDGRLPISNIQSEHVAKTIAISRKNFLFSYTPSGAEASARIFSVIETARANGHNPHRYLSVLLTELPAAETPEDIEKLLPWAITPEQITQRFSLYPIP